jgi:hypothetical protein
VRLMTAYRTPILMRGGHLEVEGLRCAEMRNQRCGRRVVSSGLGWVRTWLWRCGGDGECGCGRARRLQARGAPQLCGGEDCSRSFSLDKCLVVWPLEYDVADRSRLEPCNIWSLIDPGSPGPWQDVLLMLVEG